MTDRKVALDNIRKNIEANKDKFGQHSISIKELEWGTNLQEFSRPYDIVLGADIIYIEETFPQLLETLLHVGQPHTTVLLSSKIRYSRDTLFLDMMKEYFLVEEILYDKSRDIHIYKCKRIGCSQ